MRNQKMTLTSATFAGVGLGALAMYFLDPNRGRVRRALVRDKAVHAQHVSGRSIRVRLRDVSNRLQGIWAEMRGSLRSAGETADDDVLISRVRSQLGRHASGQTRHVEVRADRGTVTLAGEVDARRIPELIHCAATVRGVKSVDNQLRSTPASVSSDVM